MAILVCYSESLEDHAHDRAIYLDHAFYKLIFKHCRNSEKEFPVLKLISGLRYKSPAILISAERIKQLEIELNLLAERNHAHLQLNEFKNVCQNAIDRKTSLTVSGDMYPELTDGNVIDKLIAFLRRI